MVLPPKRLCLVDLLVLFSVGMTLSISRERREGHLTQVQCHGGHNFLHQHVFIHDFQILQRRWKHWQSHFAAASYLMEACLAPLEGGMLTEETGSCRMVNWLSPDFSGEPRNDTTMTMSWIMGPLNKLLQL